MLGSFFCWDYHLDPSRPAQGCLKAEKSKGVPGADEIGELPRRWDFKQRAGGGRKGVGGVGRQRGRFGLRHSQEWQKGLLPSALEAPNSEDSTGNCIGSQSEVRYQSIEKSKWKFRLK
jgi:hypothetical protein